MEERDEVPGGERKNECRRVTGSEKIKVFLEVREKKEDKLSYKR